MSLSEKAAYLKGLADGIKLDESKDTEKLLKAVIDAIGEISETVDLIDEDLDEISMQVDAVDEDLADLEDYIYDDECDCCGGHDDYDDEEYYDVKCPECGEIISVDEGILEEGGIDCPNCGAALEFDCECDDCDDGDGED